MTELPFVGRKTPVAVGPGPEVAQAFRARIEKLNRYLTQGSFIKPVEFRRDVFIATTGAQRWTKLTPSFIVPAN